MPSNTSMGAPNGYANITAISHNIKDLEQVMKNRNKSELRILKAVNDLASATYGDVKKQQSKWNLIKNLSLSSSFILLSVTTAILFLSPMLTQKQFSLDDARVWVMGGLMAFVALAVAVVIDYGRSKILDRSNNGTWTWIIYIVFTVISVGLSTTGMLAIADFYESSNQTDVKGDIDTARKYLMDNASMSGVTLAGLDSQQARYDKKFYTKGTGYKRRAHLRDTARIESERAQLNKYLSAKSVIEGKAQIMETTDSSNWLFNTYAKILVTSTSLAALFIGIFINLVSESMALVAHYRLIRLNARIELTDTQWNSAIMASDRATIVNSSSLQLVAGLDTFQHTFAMPFSVLNKYHRSGATMGDFANTNPANQNENVDIEIVEPEKPLLDNKLEAMRQRYIDAQRARKGDSVQCPTCIKQITKKAHNTIFCSSKGADNCKDEYHNTLNPERIGARK